MANQENTVWWPTNQTEAVVRAMQLLEKTGTEYSNPAGAANTPYWHVGQIVAWSEPLALGTGKKMTAESFENNVWGILSNHGVDAGGVKGKGYFEGIGEGLYLLTPIGRGYCGG